MVSGVLEAGEVEGHVEEDDEGAAHADDEPGGLLGLPVVSVPLLARVRPEGSVVAEERAGIGRLS